MHWLQKTGIELVCFNLNLDPIYTGLVTMKLGPNIHRTSNYGTGIVFIGNMLSQLSCQNFL